MKSIKILSILIFLSVFSYGQIAFYDANKIKSEITISKTLGGKISFEVDTNSMSSFCQIFKNYTPDSLLLKANSDSALFIEIKSWLKNNPFITIGGTQKSFSFSNNNSQNKVFSLSSVYSSIGNLNVTNFADGFAKFIVKRTKQELSITFFEQFKKDLETNEQIKILFPATYKALKAIDQEIYNYTAYLDLLRESFQKDLALLIPNISKLIDSPCMNDVFSKCPGIRIMLSDAIYFANEFSKGQHPGELIHNFVNEKADEDSLKKINPYFYPSLQTLDLFSQSLRSKQTDQYWINQDSLKLLLSDKTTFQIYIGLIYQEALNNKINFNDSLLKGILKSIKDKIDTIKPFIAGIVSKGKNIDYYYNEIRKKQNAGKDQPTYQDYYSLYDASLNFSEYLAQVPAVLNLPTLNDDKKLNS